MKIPQAIIKSEWKEIINIPAIIKRWEIGKIEDVASFSSRIYGAKFKERDDYQELKALYLLSQSPDGITSMLYRRFDNQFVFVK